MAPSRPGHGKGSQSGRDTVWAEQSPGRSPVTTAAPPPAAQPGWGHALAAGGALGVGAAQAGASPQLTALAQGTAHVAPAAWHRTEQGQCSPAPAPPGLGAPPTAPGSGLCSMHPPSSAAQTGKPTSPAAGGAWGSGARALGLISDACQGHGWGEGAQTASSLLWLPCAGSLPHPTLSGPWPPPGHGPRAKWALTTTAKVVSLVQPEEALLAGRAGLAAHMGLAEALAVALGAEKEGGTR